MSSSTQQATLPFIGNLLQGERNAITDVPGVTVGHQTLSDGGVQTGVTVIRPHAGDPFRDKVPAAAVVINGFGKSVGLLQVEELGVLETPIALTNTFSVPARWPAAQIRDCVARNPETAAALPTVNPLVFECNDGYLNDIQRLAVTGSRLPAGACRAPAKMLRKALSALGAGMSSFQAERRHRERFACRRAPPHPFWWQQLHGRRAGAGQLRTPAATCCWRATPVGDVAGAARLEAQTAIERASQERAKEAKEAMTQKRAQSSSW
jgi:hypothetical protein